jgi:nitrogen regulatory protein P-II 1
MAYFVMLVLHEVELLDQVLTAWEEVGVSGVTVLASTGLGRLRSKAALREDLPLIPSLQDIISGDHEEMLNRTMFSIVESDDLVDRLFEATESVVGDLSRPRTGILVVMPIARVYGLKEAGAHKKKGTHENTSG